MDLALYQVDAFANRLFAGNPAAVVPLSSWLPDDVLQAIAAENNVSETAFLVPANDGYRLRWFTPLVETELCGHATLAAAFVLLTRVIPEQTTVGFDTMSGRLTVTRDGDSFTLELPAQPPLACSMPERMLEAVGGDPNEVLAAVKYLLVFQDELEVAALRPDFATLADIDRDGVIVTAPGRECDFVSRYFAPHAGIPEDPVTGSAHCTLVPYWAARLGRDRLRARQISRRGGELDCALIGSRVRLSGRAILYMEGRIHV
jgi:PhzF family phenazine biosynthesis protein